LAAVAPAPQITVEQLRLGIIGVSDGHAHGGWAAIVLSARRA